MRTQKFLCALANGVTILNSQFIDTCLSSGAIPNPNDFILVDKANEKRFGVNLATSVAKAQSASRRPLDGFAVYCTEGIPNGPETYRAIVEANGGEFSVYKGKGTLREREDGDGETVYLLTGLGPKDRLLWKKFEDMAKKAKHVPRIAVTEWLLDAAMLQEVRWKEDYNALTRG